MGFKKTAFKNLIEHKSGYTWSKEQEVDKPEPNTVRVLTITNVQEKLDLKEELYLKDVKIRDKIEKAVSKDWCLAVSSNGNRKRIGNAVFINDDTNYLFASFLTAFKPKSDSFLIPEYFFYWLSSHSVQERISSVSEGTTGLGNLNMRYLRNMEIDFPEDIKEQTAIATILSKVDEAIAATENSIKAAERLKKALMQNLLAGKLKPDGTWRKEEEFYVDEKFGKIPIGWEVNRLGKLVEKITDGEHLSPIFEDSGEPIISAEDVLEDGIHFEKAKYVSTPACIKYRKRCDPDFGDILIVSRGASVGRTCKVNITERFCMMGSVILIKPNTELLVNDFISLYLKTYEAWKELRRLSGSSAQQAIYLAHLKKMRISYPTDVNEQLSISEKFEGITDTIIQKQAKIKTLERLKKSLMQNLLTGKVRVDIEKIEELLKIN